MLWTFRSDRPIYLQLLEHIKLAIISGAYSPGGKLPAVRDIAVEAAVNPNTVQKALTELEREGLVFAQRTSGRFVTEDVKLIESVKNELALEQIEAFLEKMASLGYSAGETIAILEKKAGEEK